MFIFKEGIDFSSPADSCHIFCVLEMCCPIQGCPPPHTTNEDDNSEIFNASHIMDISKNQFHNVIYFLHGIDSVELMPGAASLKV
jgi:hypothetical protein